MEEINGTEEIRIKPVACTKLDEFRRWLLSFYWNNKKVITMSLAKAFLEKLSTEKGLLNLTSVQNPADDYRILVFSQPSYSLNNFIKEINRFPKKDTSKYEQVLMKLIEIGPDDWMNMYVKEYLTEPSETMSEFDIFVSQAHAPYIKDLQHRSPEVSDFVGVSENTEKVISLVKCLFIKLKSCGLLDSQEGKQFIVKVLPPLLVLLLEHQKLNPWSSDKSMSLSSEVLHFMMDELEVSSLTELLQRKSVGVSGGVSTVLCKIMNLLNKKLKKDCWMCYPSLKHVLCQCLLHTKFPVMSEHFQKFLPISLLFIDDHVLEHKILGIQCLHHIIQNTTAEELRWYGQADVIYEALRQQMYSREASLINVLHPALLDILSVVEKNPQLGTDSLQRAPSKYDEILQAILSDAYGEQRLDLRMELTRHLSAFVDKMGLTSLRHTKMLLKVVQEYLEVYDGKTHSSRCNILQLLNKFITVTWPRISHHTDFIMKILVKFLTNIAMSESEYDPSLENELVKLTTECLFCLKCTNKQYVEEHLSKLCKVELPDLCISSLKNVINMEIN